MKSIFHLVRLNAGFALLVTNIVLGLVALAIYDPFGLVGRGYTGSALLARGAGRETDVREVRITFPDNGGYTVRMTRMSQVPGQKLDEQAGPQFQWKARITKGPGGSPAEYAADRERIRELFRSLREARRYYGLKRSPEKDRDLELAKDEQGRNICPQLTLVTENGKEQTLYLGRASGGESYVRVGEENEVFLVQANLKSAIGGADAHFFRNRSVIVPELGIAQIQALSAEFPAQNRKLSIAIAAKGGGWELHGYAQGPADTSAVEELLSEILSWKATSFPAEVPKDADRKQALTLTIYTRTTPLSGKAEPHPTKGGQVRLDILGSRDTNNYFVRTADGSLYEVSSAALGNLFEAQTKLAGRGRGPIRLPEERLPGE